MRIELLCDEAALHAPPAAGSQTGPASLAFALAAALSEPRPDGGSGGVLDGGHRCGVWSGGLYSIVDIR